MTESAAAAEHERDARRPCAGSADLGVRSRSTISGPATRRSRYLRRSRSTRSRSTAPSCGTQCAPGLRSRRAGRGRSRAPPRRDDRGRGGRDAGPSRPRHRRELHRGSRFSAPAASARAEDVAIIASLDLAGAALRRDRPPKISTPTARTVAVRSPLHRSVRRGLPDSGAEPSSGAAGAGAPKA